MRCRSHRQAYGERRPLTFPACDRNRATVESLTAETGGNLDEAQRLAQDATRQEPSNPAFAETLGWIYVKKKQPDSAIQILRNNVTKHPDRTISRYHLAMALMDKGDKAEAKVELQAALAPTTTAEAQEAALKAQQRARAQLRIAVKE